MAAPSSAQLAAFATTYSGSEGSLDSNFNFTPSASASLIFNADGTASYNGASYAIHSACVESLTGGIQVLYLHSGTQGMSHFDLFSHGAWAGVAPNGNIVQDVPYGGGGGGGGGAAVQTSGPGYTISYSAYSLGLDTRGNVTANFNAATGALESYSYSADEAPGLGTLSHDDVAGDGVVTIGRWYNGTSGGVYYTLPTFTLNQYAGFHYAVGKPATSVPSSGVADYAISLQTGMTFGGFNVAIPAASGSVKVDHANNKVAVNLSWTIDGTPYTITTTGGLTTLASSEVSINGSTFSGAGLIGASSGAPLTVYIQGFFAGDNARDMALVVRLDNNTGSSWGSAALLLTRQ